MFLKTKQQSTTSVIQPIYASGWKNIIGEKALQPNVMNGVAYTTKPVSNALMRVGAKHTSKQPKVEGCLKDA